MKIIDFEGHWQPVRSAILATARLLVKALAFTCNYKNVRPAAVIVGFVHTCDWYCARYSRLTCGGGSLTAAEHSTAAQVLQAPTVIAPTDWRTRNHLATGRQAYRGLCPANKRALL